MESKHYLILKYALIGILLLVGIVTWTQSYNRFVSEQDELVLQFEQIFQTLALPIRTAQLSLEDEITELPQPVYGVQLSEIGDTWGAARSEGRTHEGVDIFAPRGTPVFSATPGYVVRTNIGSRGGLNVMVMGPGGLRYYYAHFDRVAEGITVGERVNTDTILGFVGDSGNATGTPPHLHFGIYYRAWEAKNPYPLLVERVW